PVPFTRYPWRIVAIAAISLIGNVYLGCYLLFGLASDGVDIAEQSGRVGSAHVDENTAGARAGFQPGDQILSVNAHPIGTVVDWLAHRVNFQAKQPGAVRGRGGGEAVD